VRFIMAALAALFASGACAQTFEMKLASSVNNDPQIVWLTEFKSRIETQSNGRIKAQVFPGGQLGSPADIVGGLLLGSIEMYSIPPGFLKGVAAPFEVIEVPGLFQNHEQAHKIVTDASFHDPFLRIAEAKGIVGAAMWVYGPSGSYVTRSPIRSLADFRGTKIGVRATKVETEILDKLGGVGVPVNWPEAIPLIQNKTTDGQRSSLVTLTGAKFYSVAKNATMIDDSWAVVGEFFSTKFLEKLPGDLRQMLFATARDMEPFGTKLGKEAHAKAEEQWKENGGEIIRFTAAEQAKAIERVAPVGDSYLGANENPDTRKFYGILKELAAKSRAS
jgi:TRAP-type C4-dicarboxylate transport system substrate-binding protein